VNKSTDIDREVERAVLGAVLLAGNDQGESMAAVNEAGGARLFFLPSSQAYWQGFVNLHGRGIEVTPITLLEELSRLGTLEEAGGAAALNALYDGLPRFSDLQPYLATLREAAIARYLRRWGQWTISAIEDGEMRAEEIATNLKRYIEGILGESAATEIVSSKSVFDDTMAWLEEVWAGNVQRLTTGFPDLDYLAVGLEPGDLIFLAGLRASGKSAMALQIAQHVLMQSAEERVVLFATLEMSKRMLSLRAKAQWAQVSVNQLRTGRLTDTEKDAVRKASWQLRSMQMDFVEPAGNLTVPKLKALAERTLRQRGRLDLVVVDYLQLLSGDKKQSKVERVQEMSAMLKRMAVSVNVPVLCLSSMNRSAETENREPRLSDLDYGGEKDADQVWMLHDPKDERAPQKRQLFVRKNRNGEPGTVTLGFTGRLTRFYSVTRGED